MTIKSKLYINHVKDYIKNIKQLKKERDDALSGLARLSEGFNNLQNGFLQLQARNERLSSQIDNLQSINGKLKKIIRGIAIGIQDIEQKQLSEEGKFVCEKNMKMTRPYLSTQFPKAVHICSLIYSN